MKGQTKVVATATKTEVAQPQELQAEFNPCFEVFHTRVGYLKHNEKLVKAEIKSYTHDYRTDKTECEILLTHGENNTETIVFNFADIVGKFYSSEDTMQAGLGIETKMFDYNDKSHRRMLNGTLLKNETPYVFSNGFPQRIELNADICTLKYPLICEITILSLQDQKIYKSYTDALAFNEIIVEDENGAHTIGGEWIGSELNEEQTEAVKKLEAAFSNLKEVGLNLVMDENEDLCFIPKTFGFFGYLGEEYDDATELEGWYCHKISSPFSFYCESSVYKRNKE